MKKLLILLPAIVLLLSFTKIFENKKASAEVNSYEGVFVFVDSKPTTEYEYLGTVKVTFTMGSGQYTDLRDKLLKKAKKEYPRLDAIVINPKDMGSDKADVIKFK